MVGQIPTRCRYDGAPPAARLSLRRKGAAHEAGSPASPPRGPGQRWRSLPGRAWTTRPGTPLTDRAPLRRGSIRNPRAAPPQRADRLARANTTNVRSWLTNVVLAVAQRAATRHRSANHDETFVWRRSRRV